MFDVNSEGCKHTNISPIEPQTPRKKRATTNTFQSEYLVSVPDGTVCRQVFQPTPLPRDRHIIDIESTTALSLPYSPYPPSSPATPTRKSSNLIWQEPASPVTLTKEAWLVPASIGRTPTAATDDPPPLYVGASSSNLATRTLLASSDQTGNCPSCTYMSTQCTHTSSTKHHDLTGNSPTCLTACQTVTQAHLTEQFKKVATDLSIHAIGNELSMNLGPETGSPLVEVYGGQRHNKFKADQIIDVDNIPYYPLSSNSTEKNVGVLYVINMAQMRPEHRNTLHSSIAYSHSAIGSSNTSFVKYANSGPMLVQRFQCRGVKICSGLHSDIVHRHLGGVSAENLLRQNAKLGDQREDLDLPELPTEFKFGPSQRRLDLKAMSFAIGQQIETRIMDGKFCHHVDRVTKQQCQGKPELRHVCDTRVPPEADSLGHSIQPMTWLLGCSMWKAWAKENTHFTIWNLEDKVDIAIFTGLLATIVAETSSVRSTGSSRPPEYMCASVLHYSARKLRCSELHGTAKCTFRNSNDVFGKCPVSFNLLTPCSKTLVQDRAYLFVCGGHHNHAPSPPDKTPMDILEDIKIMLTRMEPSTLLDLTPTQILARPEFGDLLKLHNADTLNDVHPSLKVDLITNLIARLRHLAAPDGRSFKAVVLQYQRECTIPTAERYVREAVEVDGSKFVICFTNLGVGSLYSNEYFEADLAFKRVKGDFCEMEIVTFDQSQSRTITHARVFMDTETKEAYAIAFRLLFQSIARELKRPVLTFHHLDTESNLHAVISDFDTKQSAGLGQYLQSVDSHARSWNWQVTQCIRYCTVHFFRGIDKNYRTHECRPLMQALLRCTSLKTYQEQLDRIEAKWPETAGWVKHKKQAHIACGLIKAASGIDDFVWSRIPAHTNVSESAHHTSNSSGVRLALLHAIETSKKHDRNSDERTRAFENTGARATQRAKSTVTHLTNAMAQQERRRQARVERDHDSDQEDLHVIEILSVESNGDQGAFLGRVTDVQTSPLYTLIHILPLRQ